MPEVHLPSAPKPALRHQKVPQRRPRHHGFTTTLLAEASTTIPGSTTTEHEMLFWVGLFFRLHQQRKHLIPVQIKTLDCPVEKADGSLVLRGDGQPALMRCVREVALREARGQISWEVIEYAVGVPGVRFCPYPSLSEAMARFDAAPEPVRLS